MGFSLELMCIREEGGTSASAEQDEWDPGPEHGSMAI